MNTNKVSEFKSINDEFDKYNSIFNEFDFKYPFRRIVQKRKFHSFCVGTPKSGTTSIPSMFSNYRTYHEITDTFLISLIRKSLDKQISINELESIFKKRDKRMWLEMDSSHYNAFFVGVLHNIYPQAKFILTLRDCISWIDSWFNHQVSRETQPDFSIYDFGRRNYYSRGYSYTKYDSFLEELNLFPLKSYFEFWNDHNSKVIRTIPENQLLILKTEAISTSTDKIASFLQIPTSSLKVESSHKNKAKGKHNILEKIDPEYLKDVALEFCGELNDKYFPEKTITHSLDLLNQK